MSWIHRDDLVRLIVHGLAMPALSGPVNGTAPVPVTNRAFTAAVARAPSSAGKNPTDKTSVPLCVMLPPWFRRRLDT